MYVLYAGRQSIVCSLGENDLVAHLRNKSVLFYSLLFLVVLVTSDASLHFPLIVLCLQDVVCGLDVLHNAVHRLVSLYCTSFHPGYAPKWEEQLNQGSSSGKTYISSYPEQLLRIKIAALHRPYLEELQK